MALEYGRKEGPDMSNYVEMDERLYLTEDGKRVVPGDHKDARWLWCVAGSRVLRAEAEKLGALKKEPEPEQEPAQSRRPGRPPGSKNRKPAEDKARTPQEDK